MLFCSLIARSNSQDGRGCASTRWSINVCFKFSVNLSHVLCVLCGWYLLTCFSNICTFCALIWWSLLPLKAFSYECMHKKASLWSLNSCPYPETASFRVDACQLSRTCGFKRHSDIWPCAYTCLSIFSLARGRWGHCRCDQNVNVSKARCPSSKFNFLAVMFQ